MSTQLLYSTNVFLKYYIQMKFRLDVHYVWCSKHFDSNALHRYALGAGTARTSNPAEIYRQLKLDIENEDWQSLKINAQKASLTKLAIDWEQRGEINKDVRDEIIYMVDKASFKSWRPLLYVIPRNPVATRLKLVPIHQRASYEEEYILDDLKRSEFDIIEF